MAYPIAQPSWAADPRPEPALASWAAPVQEAPQGDGGRGFFAGRESQRTLLRRRGRQGEAAAEALAHVKVVEQQQQFQKVLQAKYGVAAEKDPSVCPCCGRSLAAGGPVVTFKDGRGAMHAECFAKKLQAEDEKRQLEDRKEKAARHQELHIGWDAVLIPQASAMVLKMDGFLQAGMVCIVLRDDNTVHLAPTNDSTAAINLEYLMWALEIRRSTGAEARFSLDPSTKEGMQVKRYNPPWLAGTSAGDVMFQADYYLKEVAMGEVEQPVVGMKSCFDMAVEEGLDRRWQGREWFVVRQAEVSLSDDNVVVPIVKMAVEAREQVQDHKGLHDAPITRQDHPLVKYAEAFTENLPLIAERKGAIYHLREFVKASVVAKFLLEAAAVPDSWMAPRGNSAMEAKQQEIPRLFSERGYKRIQMQDLSDPNFDANPQRIGIYGGININLGEVAPARWAEAAGVMMGAIQLEGQPGAAAPGAVAAAVPGAGVARAVRSRRSALKMRATRRGPRILEGPGLPQGVDLNLDDFDLMSGHLANRKLQAPVDAACRGGKAFWSMLEGNGALKEADRDLLRSVFNGSMTDRKDEGDMFLAPDPSCDYVEKLRRLVEAEDEVRAARRVLFLSPDFCASNPGPAFPPSWSSRIQLVQEAKGQLDPRPGYKPARDSMRPDTVTFEKFAEDGCRYRIYRPGSMELRTFQAVGGKEEILAAFMVK